MKKDSNQRPDPQAEYYTARRKKKRSKILRRSILFLLLAMTALILYQKRASWIPKFETTISRRHESHRPEDQSTPDGNFPIYVYGETDYQMRAASQKLFVLSASYLQIFDTDGSLMDSRQHTYGNAMLHTEGDYALVYESGGTRFRLDTVRKCRYEKTISDSILYGRVSSEGEVLLITSSQTCACKMLVMNAKGQQIYERDCVENVIAAAFHADGGGCYTASLEMESGVLKSVVRSCSFSSKEDLWVSQPLDTLVISVYNMEGGVCLIGDTRCCFLEDGGAVKSSYVYPDSFAGCDCVNGTAALLLTNSERRTCNVVILRGSADSPAIRDYDRDVKSIQIVSESDSVLVEMRGRIEALNYDGGVTRTVAIPDSYDGFVRIGSDFFLRGYDTIDRVSFIDEQG